MNKIAVKYTNDDLEQEKKFPYSYYYIYLDNI